jgi:hypothetical protein
LKRQEDLARLEQTSKQERAQLTLQVDTLCEVNKGLAVKVEQQAAELRNIHLP